MNTLFVFLGILWAVAVLATVAFGFIFTRNYAFKADRRDFPLWKALGGTGLRILATIVLVSLLVGIPLDIAGF